MQIFPLFPSILDTNLASSVVTLNLFPSISSYSFGYLDHLALDAPKHVVSRQCLELCRKQEVGGNRGNFDLVVFVLECAPPTMVDLELLSVFRWLDF